MSITHLFVKGFQFVKTLIDLRLKGRLFFQSRADLPIESGNTTPRPFQVSGSKLGFRDSFPKEVIRFQFSQLVEGIADVPQGIESLSVGGKRFELCLYNAQLTFERFTFFADSLDLRVEWRQFLF
jgi:hypothetical protein